MSRGINVFKCIVNISSQDFGVYFRGKANFGVGSKTEQHGDSGEVINDESEVVMEAGWLVGENEGWFWALVVFMDEVGWIGELRSLLGWLWWRWILRLGGEAEILTAPFVRNGRADTAAVQIFLPIFHRVAKWPPPLDTPSDNGCSRSVPRSVKPSTRRPRSGTP